MHSKLLSMLTFLAFAAFLAGCTDPLHVADMQFHCDTNDQCLSGLCVNHVCAKPSAGKDVIQGKDTGYDMTCVPNCEGRQCGDNGCGGSCGTCANDQICIQGACKKNFLNKLWSKQVLTGSMTRTGWLSGDMMGNIYAVLDNHVYMETPEGNELGVYEANSVISVPPVVDDVHGNAFLIQKSGLITVINADTQQIKDKLDINAIKDVRRNSEICSAPALNSVPLLGGSSSEEKKSDLLYVLTSKEQLVIMNMNDDLGLKLFRLIPLNKEMATVGNCPSSLIITNAVVTNGDVVTVITRAGTMKGFDSLGKKLWTSEFLGMTHSLPVMDDNGNTYIGTDTGKLYVVDAKGRADSIFHVDENIRTAPLLGEEGIFFTTTEGVYELSQKDHSVKWINRDIRGSSSKIQGGMPVFIAVALLKQGLVLMNQEKGNLVLLSLKNGEPIVDLPMNLLTLPIIMEDDVIVFLSRDNLLSVYSGITRGQGAWSQILHDPQRTNLVIPTN